MLSECDVHRIDNNSGPGGLVNERSTVLAFAWTSHRSVSRTQPYREPDGTTDRIPMTALFVPLPYHLQPYPINFYHPISIYTPLPVSSPPALPGRCRSRCRCWLVWRCRSVRPRWYRRYVRPRLSG